MNARYLFEVKDPGDPETEDYFKSLEKELRAIIFHVEDVGLQYGLLYLIKECAQHFGFTYVGYKHKEEEMSSTTI